MGQHVLMVQCCINALQELENKVSEIFIKESTCADIYGCIEALLKLENKVSEIVGMFGS